ncbi:hypothetical protein C7M84_009555 [Penaeus vannamei]|uniref:Uncharacterized protein n=1 Tax=Penaeus vannamei TaxID=6689 RepID=A0A423T6F2_PENVA|nr:hypothetical protein C7M84_009555 [Penaeus vannamei]
MYYIIWAAAADAGDSQNPREGQRIICQLSTPPSGLVSRLAAGKRNLLCLARRAVAPLGAVWCGFAHLVTCFGVGASLVNLLSSFSIASSIYSHLVRVVSLSLQCRLPPLLRSSLVDRPSGPLRSRAISKASQSRGLAFLFSLCVSLPLVSHHRLRRPLSRQLSVSGLSCSLSLSLSPPRYNLISGPSSVFFSSGGFSSLPVTGRQRVENGRRYPWLSSNFSLASLLPGPSAALQLPLRPSLLRVSTSPLAVLRLSSSLSPFSLSLSRLPSLPPLVPLASSLPLPAPRSLSPGSRRLPVPHSFPPSLALVPLSRPSVSHGSLSHTPYIPLVSSSLSRDPRAGPTFRPLLPTSLSSSSLPPLSPAPPFLSLVLSVLPSRLFPSLPPSRSSSSHPSLCSVSAFPALLSSPFPPRWALRARGPVVFSARIRELLLLSVSSHLLALLPLSLLLPPYLPLLALSLLTFPSASPESLPSPSVVSRPFPSPVSVKRATARGRLAREHRVTGCLSEGQIRSTPYRRALQFPSSFVPMHGVKFLHTKKGIRIFASRICVLGLYLKSRGSEIEVTRRI